ncbi:peptide-O-fucosyltransferase activity protein [Homalodisca vitripennis]|nr:peptide-O-fucosyltransferase activity protein [Homalodisca vitripennis]
MCNLCFYNQVRACEHIKTSPNLFAAPQCLGYRNEYGLATQDMCFPPLDVIVKQLKRLLRNSKDVASIFVASDSNHMIKELTTSLKKSEVTVHKLEQNNPHLDLAILGRANYFVGNCISSFSAFVKRERDVRKFPSAFWGFPPPRGTGAHDEL